MTTNEPRGEHGPVFAEHKRAKYLWIHLLFVCLAIPGRAGSDRQSNDSHGYSGPITLADALSATLRYHPALQSKRWDIVAGQGLRREASGKFDTVLGSNFSQQRTVTPVGPGQQTSTSIVALPLDQTASITGYSLNLTKQFRSGFSVNTLANVGRNADNLVNLGGISTSQYQLQFVLPLMRGRGREVVGAQEDAASIEVHSREMDFRQNAEQLLTNTAISYWNLVAAKRNLEVARGSEERGRVLLETVSALIKADQKPLNDIYEVRANYSARKTDRIASEQSLVQAREQLALDMGLTSFELLSLTDPKDDFPAIDNSLETADREIELQYAQDAWENRSDAIATREREKQAVMLLKAARNGVKPQVNLQFSTGYQQLRPSGGLADFFGSSFSNLHHPDLQAGLVFQLPHGNNVAQGQFMEADAQKEQAHLRSEEARREITVTVTVALENVRNSVLQVKSAREAVDAFQRAVDGAQVKFRLGQSSITELITVEDELTTALSREVQAEQGYAIALANLRQATGTILPAGQADHIDPKIFESIPK